MARRKPTPPPRAIGVPGDVRLMNATAALLAALGVLALGVVAALWMARQPVFALRAIRVEGDAVVKVCADPYYDTCAIFDHSVNKLPLHLDNEISSYIVSSGDDGIPDLPEDDNPDGAVIILH